VTATGRDRAGSPYARSLGPVCQRRVKTIHSAATRYLLLGVVPVERDPWWIVVRSAILCGPSAVTRAGGIRFARQRPRLDVVSSREWAAARSRKAKITSRTPVNHPPKANGTGSQNRRRTPITTIAPDRTANRRMP